MGTVQGRATADRGSIPENRHETAAGGPANKSEDGGVHHYSDGDFRKYLERLNCQK
jgi:hypothetical protein